MILYYNFTYDVMCLAYYGTEKNVVFEYMRSWDNDWQYAPILFKSLKALRKEIHNAGKAEILHDDLIQ